MFCILQTHVGVSNLYVPQHCIGLKEFGSIRYWNSTSHDIPRRSSTSLLRSLRCEDFEWWRKVVRLNIAILLEKIQTEFLYVNYVIDTRMSHSQPYSMLSDEFMSDLQHTGLVPVVLPVVPYTGANPVKDMRLAARSLHLPVLHSFACAASIAAREPAR